MMVRRAGLRPSALAFSAFASRAPAIVAPPVGPMPLLLSLRTWRPGWEERSSSLSFHQSSARGICKKQGCTHMGSTERPPNALSLRSREVRHEDRGMNNEESSSEDDESEDEDGDSYDETDEDDEEDEDAIRAMGEGQPRPAKSTSQLLPPPLSPS